MKSHYVAFLILISFTVSCSDPEVPDFEIEQDLDLLELEYILNGELLTPLGKLKSKSVYYQFT